MAFFSRLSEIVSANLHGILDRFEDPMKMAKLFVREMEEGYEKAKLALAHQIAAERRLAAERVQADEHASAWQARAGRALADGDEELAREAIGHRIEQLDAVKRLDEILAEDRAVTEALRSDLGKVEEKLTEMRRQRDELLARTQVRKVAKHVDSVTGAAARPGSASGALQRASDRLSVMHGEARALAEIEGGAGAEVVAAFEDAEQARRVEDDLAALKREVGADDGSQSGGR